MQQKRRLDTSTGAGDATAVQRIRFDSHMDSCGDCVPRLCATAENLWRRVCLAAIKQKHENVDGTMAAVVVGGSPVQGHPGGAK